MTFIVGGELFTDYSHRSPSQTCHAKPKTQINRRRTLPASFPLVGCLPQAAWPERLLRKVRTLWHCSRWGNGALRLIVVISVRQSTVAAISGLHRALVMVQFEHKADNSCKIQRSGRNSQRDWCMAKSPRLSRSGCLHHRLPVMGC